MSDQHDILRLKNKEYRHSYLEDHIHAGIAYQIQAMREKAGLSQQEFGELVGKKQSAICRMENPDYTGTSVSTLINIAKSLDVAVTVRFCSYPEFLEINDDVSPSGLAVDTYSESVQKLRDGKGGGASELNQMPQANNIINDKVLFINYNRHPSIQAGLYNRALR